jgi:hypothetical protein
VDELRKASDRFDLPSIDETAQSRAPRPECLAKTSPEPEIFSSSSPLLDLSKFDVPVVTANQTEEIAPNPQPLSDIGHLTAEQQENGSEYRPINAIAVPNEPAWLGDFDPELIDSLRGLVNFID